jgi:type IV pilus assembly protein PilQ
VKKYLGWSGGLITSLSASILVAQAPSWAVPTPVTGVQINQTGNGISVILATGKGDRPEVFTVSRDNSLVADIVNAQLNLPDSKSFLQLNPAPGIASIEVTPIDTNSIRVIVRSSTNVAPSGQILQGQGQGIVLGVTPGNGQVAATPPQGSEPPPTATPPVIQTPPNQNQDVLVPNPSITITRSTQPPLPSEIQPPLNQAPPLQPRAVAPPLGDIAVSNIDPSPSAINLGTAERIPRLVLRDAPVREVLSLLSRAAGLNIAFTTDDSSSQQTQPGAQPGAQAQSPQSPSGSSSTSGPKISLDIENESVQDVFNYVLRLSGLQANRIGRTIFVGTKLPLGSRNIIVRTLRMNQVDVKNAAIFLAGQGAEVQQLYIAEETKVAAAEITQAGKPAEPVTLKKDAPKLVPIVAEQSKVGAPRLLEGLAVSTDDRLNAITLIGEPRKVDLAIAFLTQLDLRRRQVAVNVKIIDINLSGAANYNSSFSFGINKSFFVNDGGAASLNFGGLNPPTTQQARASVVSPTVIGNPLAAQTPFYDANGKLITVPLTAPGRGGQYLPGIAPVTTDPTKVGVSDYTVYQTDPTTGKLQSLGSATQALFPFFQYPTRFLASLQAQIQNRNGKILTDPVLVVQEGEAANVNLTQDVVTDVTQTTTSTGLTQSSTTIQTVKGKAGLILGVKVDRIDDNGFITMQISPTVASVGSTQTLANGNTISLLQQRSLNSGAIRLRDGQTLIVSGIISDQEKVEASKIPILGDLPIIGSLFRKTNKTNERAEVIVLVTPQILDDSDRASWGYQYNISPDARQMLQRGLPLQNGR